MEKKLENLIISQDDLNKLYKYTMDKNGIGFWLCQDRYFPDEFWDEVKPIYKKYLDKNINEPLIDRHVLCNLNFLLSSIDMMYPYINEDDDVYNFVNDAYDSFLVHDQHNIKEKWNACIMDNKWYPNAWKTLYEEILNYFKESVNETYLYKDYFVVLYLLAKFSRSDEIDTFLNFNKNRNPIILHEFTYYGNPSAAYMNLLLQSEYIVQTEKENDRIKWYD